MQANYLSETIIIWIGSQHTMHSRLQGIGVSGNVLYITSIDISQPIGPSVNEREFIIALQKRFHSRVFLLITKPCYETDDIQDDQLTVLPPYKNSNCLLVLRHNIAMYRQGVRIVRNNSIQLIIARPSLFSYALPAICKKTHQPLYIKHLGGFPDQFMRVQSGVARSLARLIYPFSNRLIQSTMRYAIGADCCTEEHKAGAVRNIIPDESKIVVIPNATNTDRFKPMDKAAQRRLLGIDHYAQIVGYAGGRPWERGGNIMLQIAPRLIEIFPQIGFVVVGGGSGLPDLILEAKRKGLHDHFTFVGQSPYEMIPQYINAFDVGIAFDDPGMLKERGNSNQKIRQYIACGKPVITVPQGNSFIDENNLGAVVNMNETEQIVRHLTHWLGLSDAEVCQHAQRARDFACHYLSTSNALEVRIRFWNKTLLVT